MYEPPRRSGRTTRLLKHAVSVALAGRKVIVVARSQVHAMHLEWALHDLTDNAFRPMQGDNRIKVVATQRIPFIDPLTLRVDGVPRSEYDLILWDHHTLESMYAMVLDRLHQFDEGKDNDPPDSHPGP